jgi:ferri-bacillibactin esterase
MRWFGIVTGLAMALSPTITAQGAVPDFPPLTYQILGKPVTPPRETQFDFTSKVNGRSYRLQIYVPDKMEPGKTYPVIYFLDGYWYFQPAVDFDTMGDWLPPAIMVGIGYPTDDFKEQCDRRAVDLTVPPDPAAKSLGKSDPAEGDAFLQMIQDEVKPFVEKHYPVDTARQTLYGQSLGGLLVLRQIFRNPAAFQIYIAASPAIFNNDKAVLTDEPAFSEQARTGNVHLRLLITSAELEQYRGGDPKQKLWADYSRMVDNAAELAGRLKALDPKDVVVDYAVFPGKTHSTVTPDCLPRGLVFALGTAAK